MIDFEALSADILSVLEQHSIPTDNFGMHVVLSTEVFDHLFGDDPRVVKGRTLIVNVTANNVQGSIQLRRRMEFPPELILPPPQ